MWLARAFHQGPWPLVAETHSRRHQPSFHHPHLQVAADQSKDTFVFNPACQPRHENVVVDPIKELLQVHVYDPAITSAAPSAHLAAVLARGQDSRSLRVRLATFLPSTRRIYATPVRMTLGFRSMRPLAHRRGASCDSCTSGQEFAFRFLRIPPRGGHPYGSARSSCHEGLQRDLHPPSRIPVRFRSPVRSVRHDAARHA